MVERCATGSGNDRTRGRARAAAVADEQWTIERGKGRGTREWQPERVPSPTHTPPRALAAWLRCRTVRCSFVVDARLRAEHGETQNGTRGGGVRRRRRMRRGREPPGQAVCVLIDQHCCRIRLQRDGHIDWQSVSPGHNEACPPGKRFANANTVAHLDLRDVVFPPRRRGRGGEREAEKKRENGGKKYRVERVPADIFDADIGPFLFFSLSFSLSSLPDLWRSPRTFDKNDSIFNVRRCEASD